MKVQHRKKPRHDLITLLVILAVVLLIAMAFSNKPKTDNSGQSDKSPAGQNTAQSDKKASNLDSLASGIVTDAIAGSCIYTWQPKSEDLLSIGVAGSTATTQFVNLGRRVFNSEKCTSFLYTFKTDLTDARGQKTVSPILIFSVDRATFLKYDWKRFVNKNVGKQLQADSIIIKINSSIGLSPDGLDLYKLE